MKVRELIEILNSLDQEAEVEIAYTEHGSGWATSEHIEKEIIDVRADPSCGVVWLCEPSRARKKSS